MRVFERDASFSARKQGYALTMQQGATALSALGLTSAVLKESVASLAHISYSKDGKLLGAYGTSVRAAAASTGALAPPAPRSKTTIFDLITTDNTDTSFTSLSSPTTLLLIEN